MGTLMSAATFRLPGPLAISVAQVDEMSGGRVELGIGTGWYAKEHAAYGIEFPSLGERFERLSEQLEIITGLWATPIEETYSFAGQHYQLTNSPARPKPIQRPRPPVIIGGGGKVRTPELAARFADEFNMPSTAWRRPRLSSNASATRARSPDVVAIRSSCPPRRSSAWGRTKRRSNVAPGGSVERRANFESTGWRVTVDEVVEKIQSFVDAGARTDVSPDARSRRSGPFTVGR